MPPGRHAARGAVRGMLQREPHVDDIRFHALQTGKCAGTQAIFRNERTIRIVRHLQYIVARMKYIDGRAPRAPVDVAAAQRLHFVAQFRPRPAPFG